MNLPFRPPADFSASSGCSLIELIERVLAPDADDDDHDYFDDKPVALSPIWAAVERLFACIYVAALLDLEWLADQPIDSRLALEAAIDFIESARQSDAHYDLTPFRRPDFEDLLRWRPLYGDSMLVKAARIDERFLDAYPGGDWIRKVFATHPSWWRVCGEVSKAVAASIRAIDPTIGSHAPDLKIRRAVDRIVDERGYRQFEPDMQAIAVALLCSA